jgi:hypothetical protein
MIAILRNFFEAGPETLKIELIGKCSNCGRVVDIDITPTSGDVGVPDSALSKFSPERYSAECPDCLNVVSLMPHHLRIKKSKKILRGRRRNWTKRGVLQRS